MPLTKSFFDNIFSLRDMYLKQFPCVGVTVTVTAHGHEYNLERILASDDERITFCHYEKKKSKKLTAWKGTPTAWPALTLPYEAIESVEFNPSMPGNHIMVEGFKTDEEKNIRR